MEEGATNLVDWQGVQVPPHVKQVLNTKWRGQSNLGETGFTAVEMSDPLAYVGAAAIQDGAFWMLFCCDDLFWKLGRIVKIKPRARLYQFDVEWEPGPPRQQGALLENYYDATATAKPGSWAYLKKSAPDAPTGRARAPATADEDDAPPARRRRPN